MQKVSIVPRGKALGYTLNLPQEDRYLKSRAELIDYMKVLLAGRVSEQITFGRITTGAADDLARVTAIARSMVYEYAMGTQIRSHQLPADDMSTSRRRCAAPATRRSRRSPRRPTEARTALLVDHRDLLDEIAERLMRNEVIERDEIRRDPLPAPGGARQRDGAGPRRASPRSRWRASGPRFWPPSRHRRPNRLRAGCSA